VNNIQKIMVCVTRQKTCERLIQSGKKMLSNPNDELLVVHVTREGTNFLGNPHEGEALEYLFQISKKAGADMSVLRSDNVTDSLVEYAKKNDVSTIIVGESPHSHKENNIIKQLEMRLPSVNIVVIEA